MRPSHPEEDSRPIAKVSAILPIHNEARVLPRVLAAIEDQTLQPGELILVFDRCTDRSMTVAEGHGDQWVHVELGSTAGALRAGIERAHYERLVLLDANTWVPTGFLAQLEETYRGTQADLVEWHGGLMLLPKATLERYGRFSDTFLWTLEYFLRVRSQGGKIVHLRGPFTRLKPSPLPKNLRYGLEYAELSSRYGLAPFFRIGTKSGWIQDLVATAGAFLGHVQGRRLRIALRGLLRALQES